MFKDAMTNDAKKIGAGAAPGAPMMARPFPRPLPNAVDEEGEDDPGDAELARLEGVHLLNNDLHFWAACPSRHCRRHRRCCGDDADACLDLFWPAVPAEFKVWSRALADAKHDGRSPGQARRHASDEVARWRRRQARAAV